MIDLLKYSGIELFDIIQRSIPTLFDAYGQLLL